MVDPRTSVYYEAPALLEPTARPVVVATSVPEEPELRQGERVEHPSPLDPASGAGSCDALTSAPTHGSRLHLPAMISPPPRLDHRTPATGDVRRGLLPNVAAAGGCAVEYADRPRYAVTSGSGDTCE
jgi:hypothetical protein